MTLKVITTNYVPCSFREARETDRGFIFKSWMETHKASATHRMVPSALYYACQEAIINTALRQSYVIVACSPEDPDQIFGFVVCQPTSAGVCVVHWIHVKQIYRKFGIGTALMNEATHRTNSTPKLPAVMTHIGESFTWLRHKWNVEYNPYLIVMEIEDYDGREMALSSASQRSKVRDH